MIKLSINADSIGIDTFLLDDNLKTLYSRYYQG
ncbi:Uncharacterised protein [Escherichia coli]|nr:Uncharacterised protein [Escherichia coli]